MTPDAGRLAMVAPSRSRPPITRLGVAFFGTDNRYAIGKARCELGYSPPVDLRDGVRIGDRRPYQAPRREVIIPSRHHAIAWLEQALPTLADLVHRQRGWSPVREEESATWMS